MSQILSHRISPEGLSESAWQNHVRSHLYHQFRGYLISDLCFTAKERGGFGGAEDDAKFDNPWRRDGPLPDLPNSRDSSRRRFDGPRPEREERLPSLAEGPSDWRSASRPVRATEPEPSSGGPVRRKGPGFPALDGQAGAADKEEAWTMGSKFKPAPSVDESANGGGSRFGSLRGRGDMGPPGPPKEPVVEESDWRSATRPPRPTPATRNSTSRM